MKVLWHIIVHGRWVVRQCGFPYTPGYAIYNPRKRIILDTGLTYEQAKNECYNLNRGKYQP